MTISRDALVAGLSMSPKRYQRLLEPLFYFPQGHHGYSPRRGYTKGYRLKTDVREAARIVLEGDEPLAIRCRDTGAHVVPSQLPANGLPANAGLSFTVPSVLRLDLADVDQAIDTLKRWQRIHGYPDAPLDMAKRDGTTIDDGLGILSDVRCWVRSLGGIPNFLRFQSHGRLGPADGTVPSVITLPRALRLLLFSSSGLVDYDLRACFWNVFSSLGSAYGFSTKQADSYLGHRDDWHSMLAYVTRSQPHRVKTTLLSWLSGAPLSANPFTAAWKELGESGAKAIAANPVAKALHGEVHDGLKVIRDRAERIELDGHQVPVNILGLPLKGKTKKPTAAEEAAHLLAAYEQLLIRSMCSIVTDLRAVIYDGFIAPPQDPSKLEDHARAESERLLGFPLKVSLKATPFVTPEDPEADPSDF